MHRVESEKFQPRLLTTSEAAMWLGMSEHWLKTSRFRPELDGPPFVKIGRSVRYDSGDLDAWLERRKFRGTYEYPLLGERKNSDQRYSVTGGVK